MPNVPVADATLGTNKSIGRYFGLVSTIPSLVLTAWVYLLLATGALQGTPHLATLEKNLTLDQPGQLLAVFATALAVALVLHPLQFTIVQALEGYWGPTRIGQAARASRTTAHLRRLNKARAVREESAKVRHSWKREGVDVDAHLSGAATPFQESLVRALVKMTAAGELVGQYPVESTHVMPTRLGNILRLHEMRAGASVGLPILTYATHIGMVAAPSHNEYVRDQRSQVDLAARMCAMGILATGVTCLVMWPYGPWLLTALIPYTAAWLSYRGAISTAGSYGQALSAWVDLNRFTLYDALRLPPPPDTSAERVQNAMLEGMMAGHPDYCSKYQHPHDLAEPAQEPVSVQSEDCVAT
jgi:hypothetical protein